MAGVGVLPERPEVETPGPETLQLVALLVDHVIVELSPERTRAGYAEIVSVALLTVTFTVACPPLSEHTRVYSVLPEGVTSTDPEGAPPVEKFPPSALAELQDHSRVTGVLGRMLRFCVLLPEQLPVHVPLNVGGGGGGGGGGVHETPCSSTPAEEQLEAGTTTPPVNPSGEEAVKLSSTDALTDGVASAGTAKATATSPSTKRRTISLIVSSCAMPKAYQ